MTAGCRLFFDSLGSDNLWGTKNVSLWKPKAYKSMSLRKLLLLFSLVVSSLNVSATHLLGGEIIWKCQPNGTYKFTLVVYRDCGGVKLYLYGNQKHISPCR